MTQEDFTTELAGLMADGTLNGSGWQHTNGGIEGAIEYADGTRTPITLRDGTLTVDGTPHKTLTDACEARTP